MVLQRTEKECPLTLLFRTRCENISLPLLSMKRLLLESETCCLRLPCHQFLSGRGVAIKKLQIKGQRTEKLQKF